MEPPGPNLSRALARRGLAVDEAAAASAFAAEIAFYLDHHLEGRDERSLERLRDRCAEVLRAALPVDVDQATARAAMLEAIRFSVFADVAPALRELGAAGIRVAVASNWDCRPARGARAASA